MQKSKLPANINFKLRIFKKVLTAVLGTLFFLISVPLAYGATDLKVSGNGHYIETSAGNPFFYLGDTEWVLNKHDDNQIISLLDDRRAKGFTVIQVLATRNWGSPDDWARTDYNGNLPFNSNDVTQLNVNYWNRWRWTADKCAERNLYLALHIGEAGRKEDPWYCQSNSQCYEYGRKVGDTFKDKTNIIFNVGQDMHGNDGVGVDGWRAIAEGVADGVNGINNYNGSADYSTTFMTFHPRGGSPHTSSAWFHGDSWLNANGMEVWHSYSMDFDLYMVVNGDYNLTNPVKPTLMVEGSYEGESDSNVGTISTRAVRLEAWHTYFAGGAGYGYGNFNNWAIYDNINYINSAGAQQMKVLKDFLNVREWWKFVPDQGIISSGTGSLGTRKAAVSSTDGDECYVYYPTVSSASIRMDCIMTASQANATWFDPRNGNTQSVGTYTTSQIVSLTPPSGWEDALLIIKQSSATPYCGDSSCNSSETCLTCPGDCGSCPVIQSPYPGPNPVQIPGTIETENFDNGGEGVSYHDTTATNDGGAYRAGEGVDIETCTDTGDGYNLSYNKAEEWQEYSINVASTETFDIEVRVASNIDFGGTFHIEFNGVNKTGNLTLPVTGGWQSWTTVKKTGVSLSAGQQIMKLVSDTAVNTTSGSLGNYNYIKITSADDTTPPSAPSGVRVS